MQMLFANAYVRARDGSLGADAIPAVPADDVAARRAAVSLVIDWAVPFAVFSINRLMETSKAAPGKWFGPHEAASLMIKPSGAASVGVAGAASMLPEGSPPESSSPLSGQAHMRIITCNDAIVCKAELRAAATARCLNEAAGAAGHVPPLGPWQPTLALIPLRLGLTEVNAAYLPLLRALMRLPAFAGAVGGWPRHSVYFVGERGGEFLYLDPHTTQDCPPPPASAALQCSGSISRSCSPRSAAGRSAAACEGLTPSAGPREPHDGSSDSGDSGITSTEGSAHAVWAPPAAPVAFEGAQPVGGSTVASVRLFPPEWAVASVPDSFVASTRPPAAAPSCLRPASIDPTISLGYLFPSQAAFDAFCAQVAHLGSSPAAAAAPQHGDGGGGGAGAAGSCATATGASCHGSAGGAAGSSGPAPLPLPRLGRSLFQVVEARSEVHGGGDGDGELELQSVPSSSDDESEHDGEEGGSDESDEEEEEEEGSSADGSGASQSGDSEAEGARSARGGAGKRCDRNAQLLLLPSEADASVSGFSAASSAGARVHTSCSDGDLPRRKGSGASSAGAGLRCGEEGEASAAAKRAVSDGGGAEGRPASAAAGARGHRHSRRSGVASARPASAAGAGSASGRQGAGPSPGGGGYLSSLLDSLSIGSFLAGIFSSSPTGGAAAQAGGPGPGRGVGEAAAAAAGGSAGKRGRRKRKHHKARASKAAAATAAGGAPLASEAPLASSAGGVGSVEVAQATGDAGEPAPAAADAAAVSSHSAAALPPAAPRRSVPPAPPRDSQAAAQAAVDAAKPDASVVAAATGVIADAAAVGVSPSGEVAGTEPAAAEPPSAIAVVPPVPGRGSVVVVGFSSRGSLTSQAMSLAAATALATGGHALATGGQVLATGRQAPAVAVASIPAVPGSPLTSTASPGASGGTPELPPLPGASGGRASLGSSEGTGSGAERAPSGAPGSPQSLASTASSYTLVSAHATPPLGALPGRSGSVGRRAAGRGALGGGSFDLGLAASSFAQAGLHGRGPQLGGAAERMAVSLLWEGGGRDRRGSAASTPELQAGARAFLPAGSAAGGRGGWAAVPAVDASPVVVAAATPDADISPLLMGASGTSPRLPELAHGGSPGSPPPSRAAAGAAGALATSAAAAAADDVGVAVAAKRRSTGRGGSGVGDGGGSAGGSGRSPLLSPLAPPAHAAAAAARSCAIGEGRSESSPKPPLPPPAGSGGAGGSHASPQLHSRAGPRAVGAPLLSSLLGTPGPDPSANARSSPCLAALAGLPPAPRSSPRAHVQRASPSLTASGTTSDTCSSCVVAGAQAAPGQRAGATGSGNPGSAGSQQGHGQRRSRTGSFAEVVCQWGQPGGSPVLSIRSVSAPSGGAGGNGSSASGSPALLGCGTGAESLCAGAPPPHLALP